MELITEDVCEKARNGKIKRRENRVRGCDDLDDDQVTRYRALVARANYFAVDRGDIAFCVKELARCMSSPSRQDWEKLRRLARYLRHRPRCVLWYAYQGTTNEVTCFTDSDWAGCKRTRRSTSGGCMLWGSHPIKMWSRTQALVSLSSAEAELYAAIKACSETLGFLSLLQDYQVRADGKIMSDANAALGIIKRQGLGRTRHIHTSYLWIQHVNERGINFSKVPVSENCADLFTKPFDARKCRAPVRTGWNGISRGTRRNRLHHQFHRSVKTSHIIFDAIITAGSRVEWNIFHLAKNGSQVQMFPDISKRWSIMERC